jgi:pimeloyl-ACP methyl ester carboxylesterase
MAGTDKRHAAPDADNTVSTSIVPVIFVPGFIGTRLTVGKRSWDPDRLRVMALQWLGADLEDKLEFFNHKNTATILRSDPDLFPGSGKVHESREKRGHFTVVQEAYGKFIREIDEASFGTLTCPVHVAAYDWRQSPYDSASALKKAIEDVTSDKKTPKVIVVTHSMGGLVARWAFHRFRALAAKVKGVIHVAQPVAGAPKLYRAVVAGLAEEWGDGNLAKILPRSGEAPKAKKGKATGDPPSPGDAARALVLMPSAIELLPTRHYQLSKEPGELPVKASNVLPSWVAARTVPATRDPKLLDITHVGNLSNVRYIDKLAEHYDDTDGSGLYIKGLHKEELKGRLSSLGKVAMERHRALDLAKHSDTWAFVCAGRGSDGTSTEIGLLINQTDTGEQRGHTTIRAEWGGDGTVPLMSGAALYPDQAHEPTTANLKDDSNRQFRIYAGKHDACMNEERLRKALATLIPHIATRAG